MNKKNLKITQDEIDYYQPSKKIAKIMLDLTKLGYVCNGHGTDLMTGEQDFGFSLERDNINSYVSVYGNKVEFTADIHMTIEDKWSINKASSAIKQLIKKLERILKV